MNRPQLKRMTIVIGVCALIGALAGIAGSAAAPSSKSKSKSTQAQKKAANKQARALKHGFAGGFGFGGGPVHAEAVVPKEDGSGFLTVTTDAGTLNSVDGTTVHVKEGTDKKVYKDDVAIDVGSNAKVIRNHADATLSDLKAGDHVRVITGAPKGNIVIAEDDAFIAQEKKRFGQRGFDHHGGPGDHDGPGGPPPGAPGGYPGDSGGSNQNGSNSSPSGSGTNS